jgi:DUF438 domain-containing protein
MARTVDKAKVSMVAEFLRQIDAGDDMRLLAKDANRIAENMSPAELAAAGCSLLDEGYAPTIVNHLSAAFVLMRTYEQQRSGPRDPSQDGHILQKVTAEHGVFRCLAAELSEASAGLRGVECISDTAAEYRRLMHVIDHLHAMKEHFEREDDVILPYLRRVGWASLCGVAETDHAQLSVQIDGLTSLVTETNALSPEDFQRALVGCIGRFCSCLAEHLSFEDGLLWPIALVVIDNPAVWRTMKTVCEEIGYCGIHVA